MRILLVSDYAYPAGGAEHMVRRLRDAFRTRGHDARVFSTAIEPNPGDNFADYKCLGTTSRLRTLLQTANPWAATELRKVIAAFSPDIVHVRMFLTQLSPLILPVLRDQRAIYHLAWYRAICPTGRKSFPDHRPCTEAWGKACLKNRCVPARDWPFLMHQLSSTHRQIEVFRAVVANSAHVQKVMESAGIASHVIHNGVPLTDPIDAPLADAPTLLYAGRLTPEKGCQVLLRAFAQIAPRLERAELVIAGEGPYRTELERLTNDLQISNRVRFLGHLNQDALQAQTRRAWVQIVPSLWDEPFGIAALDGMMQARPVVASAAGGLAEIVQDGATGFLTLPGDVDQLAQRLLQCLTDASLRDALGSAGRRRLETHFSMDRCAEDFLALYDRLMAEPAASR